MHALYHAAFESIANGSRSSLSSVLDSIDIGDCDSVTIHPLSHSQRIGEIQVREIGAKNR